MQSSMPLVSYLKISMKSGIILWLISRKVNKGLLLMKQWKFSIALLDGDSCKMTVPIVVIFFIIILILDPNWNSYSTKLPWGNLREKSLKRKKSNLSLINLNKRNKMMKMRRIQLLRKFLTPNLLSNLNNKKKNSHRNKDKKQKVSKYNLTFQKAWYQ